MGGEWHKVPLKDVGRWLSGGTPPKNNPSYWEGRIPWISAKSMQNTQLNDSRLKVTEEGARHGTRAVPPDTILLLVRGSILHQRIPVGITTREVTFNQDVKAILPSENFLPKFLLYWFLANESQLLAKVDHTGIGAGRLPTDVLNKIDVPCPSKKEQRAIVQILSSLDDKIELNRQMNRTLEQMAQALFKSWFIDFDPVVYNAVKAGNPIPPRFQPTAARYRQNPQALNLPHDTLDLFPDAFEDSAFGDIPKGWEAATVGDCFDVTMGQSPPGSTYNETGEGLPFFQGRRDFSFRYPAKRVFCTEPKRLAKQGDTLISVRAPVGDINMAREESCIGRGVAAVRYQTSSSSFTYYSMLSLASHFSSYEGEGTVFGSINKKQFGRLPHVSPLRKAVENFESIASGMDGRIENNSDEAEMLCNLRDDLLPKLISGKLSIPNAEHFVESLV